MGRGGLLAILAIAAACSAAPVSVKVAPRPRAPLVAQLRPVAPGWPYWEEVRIALAPPDADAALPIDDARLVNLEGAAARLRAAPDALGDRVRALGFAVLARERPRTSVGALYEELRDSGTPIVVTADALFALTHLAVARAMADVEARETGPAILTMLRALDARMRAEASRAPPDLVRPYALTRAVVAVALALADPSYAPPRELAGAVAAELARIRAHEGRVPSPLFGVPIDYTSLTPRGAILETSPEAAMFRAAQWLAEAPFLFAAPGEVLGKPSAVGDARSRTRAALLLSRLLEPEAQRDASLALARVERVAELGVGPVDDWSPHELFAFARSAGLDARDPAAIANVALVDHVRHAALHARLPSLLDEVVPAPWPLDPGAIAASAVGMRLVGLRAVPDALVLMALVPPFVGPPREERATLPPERALPSALDVAAWLGSATARELLHARGDDLYAGYAETLEHLYGTRPTGEALHASVYRSLLDAIATYLAPSAAEHGNPCARAEAWNDRKLEVALGAWAELRHDALAFSRPLARPAPGEVSPAVAGQPVFVEPHPELIAKLVAAVRQASRGLGSLGGFDRSTPAVALLAEVDAILMIGLEAAVRAANDDATDLSKALSTLPSRIAAVERLAGMGDAALAIDVHADARSSYVLEEATGEVDEAYLVVREPGSGRYVLTVGASISHHELSQPATDRLSDKAWRDLLLRGAAPPRDAFAAKYVVARAAP